ncbi:hypothetical protein BH24ACT5_BH24ACT5_19490 [soil metagenome]
MSDRRLFGSKGDRFVLHLGREERALVTRLLDELRALLLEPAVAEPGSTPLVSRLFPVVHPDRPDQEAEYQRLMREELVASRLAGIAQVEAGLAGRSSNVVFDEEELVVFMQAVNGIRLVLGTMLDVSDGDDPLDGSDDDAEPAPRSDEHPTGDSGPDDDAFVAERHLYGYLSWLLDSAVEAISAGGTGEA